MERSREARRGTIPATASGLSRRRQRNSSLRDSPEKDGGVLELQEMVKLRDRASKKNQNRSSRSKRRRGERLLHGSNREDGSEESSEESLDDEEDEEDEDAVVSAASAVRPLPMNPVAPTPVSSMPSHHHQQWKSFPPKVVRAVGPPWKAADEMIGVSVPRRARSASAKRSHECWISGGNGSGGGGSGERVLQQASMSPARPSTTPVVPAAPISPSSSNASGQKQMKPVGAKHKPPKISKTTSSSSIQEIEIEVAEVLYGLTRQFQCPSKQETITSPSHKLDSKDVNGSSNDAKSRGSSPVSASPPEAPHPYVLLQNSSSTTVPSSDVAKRKRLRPVKFEEESPTLSVDPYASISSAAKVEIERLEEVENSLVVERNIVSAIENGGESSNLGSSQVHLQQEPVKPERDPVPDLKPSVAESDGQEGIETKEEISSPVKETPCAKLDVNLDDARAAKADSTACAVESLCEEKFKFDLMVPPSAKSSPERDGAPGFTIHQKPSAPEVDMAPKMGIIKIEEEKADGIVKQGAGEGGSEEKKAEAMVELVELQKQMPKERILGLQPDAEMQDKDGISSSKQQILKQHQSKATRIEPKAVRAGNSTDGKSQAASLQLPMTVPGWPGSLPLGYMGQVPSIQALVSMDRGTGSSTTIQPQFAPLQPRPKRCATHFYIAKKINYHQQFAPTNPFWPSAAGNAALYGAKPYSINTVPPTESALLLNPLQGSFVARNLSPLQDKGPATDLAAQALKEKSTTATITDSAQRKQLMLQQVPQPTSANNLLQAPAFIFPMSQQQAADAAATQSGIVKSAATISYASPSSGSTNSFAGLVGSSGPAAPTTMSFNYGSLPPNDAQYLAILQNNGYPFRIPPTVGAPLPYNGNHAQAVPFFNGSFYSSQLLHPSQLQQQQHPQAQPPIQQGHQNTKTLSSSSSSQKHKQQQQIQGCSSNGWGGSSHSFPALKQRHSQLRNQHVPLHQAQPLDSEVSGKDSTSTSDSRVPHASKNASNHNFAMLSMHPQNFSLMSPVGLGVVNQGGEKQQQQQQQHQNIRGMELTPSQAFAMSFASFNGTAAAPSVDFSSIAQSYPVFQSLPEAARHGYQMAAAAAAAAAAQAQQKNNQNIEDGRAANDSTHPNASSEEDKKAVAGKASAAMISHSLAFSRPESDLPISTVLGNGAVNSSAGTLNIITAHANGNRTSSRPSSITTPTATVTTVANAPNPTHQQQQQLIQLQKQQQQQLQLAARAKPFATNNANLYSDCLPSSVMAMSQNNVSVFPQALIQGSSSHNQSPQWKNSTRSGTTPIQSPTTQVQSVKSLPQQSRVQVRGLQATNHTQISFGVNPKVVPSAQQLPATNPSPPSAGIVVGSPSNSISKGAGGSPRTSTGSKAIPSPTAATLPSQPAKNSQSSSSRKSSPIGGRNVPSILSNSQVTATQSSSVKPQQQQQQQQQLQNKPPFQQSQLLFSNAYVQA